MAELPKAYQPAEAENKWYRYWYDHKLYDAEATSDRQPYTIVIPPPNVTGMLTIGHVLNNTIQDLYIRWKRMQGYEACWIPGTDHAGIATQTRVVKMLAEEGINYRDLGREKFLEHVWEWREKYGGIILKQLRALGVSVDWRRERFTMDEGLSQGVKEVFVRLFDKGLIYKGKKIVNWSPAAQTTLSDEEVIHKEVQDKLYTIRYRLADGDDYISISTARPETIPGDVAIAVNPEDERYKGWIGRMAIVPIGGQEVPIIADDYADPAFGTGAVKITPAHDPNDYEVGTRHNLPMPNTINPDGTMNELAGPLAGLDRFEARKKSVTLLEQADAIVSIEDYAHSVGFSERGGEQIEPYLSDQWFVRMAPLAKRAIEVVEQGLITFSPEHWTKTYMHWMTNIRDWPISRQLWWGHRIPVYYTDDGRYTAARDEAEAREKLSLAADVPLRQDEDVLDTWFSSWLWPFSLHGWGSSEKNERDLAYFYPTDLLVTGPDIIFFWVARMIMAGLEFMEGEPRVDASPRQEAADLIPFKHVYFTSIIRDAQGKKLSKSLGNSPDPLDVISAYGADALRFTIIYLAPTGQDIRFSQEACELGRNFANKLWNAGRFLMMKAEEAGVSREAGTPFPMELNDLEPVSDSDRWILSRFHSALAEVERNLNDYRINDYSKRIYEFVWNDFCDWYIEQTKIEVWDRSKEEGEQIMRFALGLYEQVLRMLHPIMPFVTEEIWQSLAPRKEGESISITGFPRNIEELVSKETEKIFEILHALVTSVRRIRGSYNVPPKSQIKVTIEVHKQSMPAIWKKEHFAHPMIMALGGISHLTERYPGTSKEDFGLTASEVVHGNVVHVHLEGLIDVEKEREKTAKEIERLKGMITGTAKKLENEKFTANAPADVVEKEREKLANFRETIEKLEETMKNYEVRS